MKVKATFYHAVLVTIDDINHVPIMEDILIIGCSSKSIAKKRLLNEDALKGYSIFSIERIIDYVELGYGEDIENALIRYMNDVRNTKIDRVIHSEY